jgi:hypothetical protein
MRGGGEGTRGGSGGGGGGDEVDSRWKLLLSGGEGEREASSGEAIIERTGEEELPYGAKREEATSASFCSPWSSMATSLRSISSSGSPKSLKPVWAGVSFCQRVK